jgi:hypothetical protein
VLKTATAPDVGAAVGAAVPTGLAEEPPGDADGAAPVPLTAFAAAAGKACPAPPPPPQAETENNISTKSNWLAAIGIKRQSAAIRPNRTSKRRIFTIYYCLLLHRRAGERSSTYSQNPLNEHEDCPLRRASQMIAVHDHNLAAGICGVDPCVRRDCRDRVRWC